jgi:hypothetical protein
MNTVYVYSILLYGLDATVKKLIFSCGEPIRKIAGFDILIVLRGSPRRKSVFG